jgi:hypothetical protein
MLTKIVSLLVVSTMAQFSTQNAISAMYYAAASYCSLDSVLSWSCGDPCNKHNDFALHQVFTVEVLGSPTNVFYGIDKTTGQVIVSFEGTDTPWELIGELTHFNQVTYGPNVVADAKVDEFFQKAYLLFRDNIISGLKQIMTSKT